MAARTAPNGMKELPSGVQSKVAKNSLNDGKSPRIFNSSLMMPMPKNSIPKPKMVSPQPRTELRLESIITSRPMKMAGIASPPRSNEMTWAVMVVPMLAPKMMPIPWVRFSKPALMKPMTITVVALED